MTVENRDETLRCAVRKRTDDQAEKAERSVRPGGNGIFEAKG